MLMMDEVADLYIYCERLRYSLNADCILSTFAFHRPLLLGSPQQHDEDRAGVQYTRNEEVESRIIAIKGDKPVEIKLLASL